MTDYCRRSLLAEIAAERGEIEDNTQINEAMPISSDPAVVTEEVAEDMTDFMDVPLEFEPRLPIDEQYITKSDSRRQCIYRRQYDA